MSASEISRRDFIKGLAVVAGTGLTAGVIDAGVGYGVARSGDNAKAAAAASGTEPANEPAAEPTPAPQPAAAAATDTGADAGDTAAPAAGQAMRMYDIIAKKRDGGTLSRRSSTPASPPTGWNITEIQTQTAAVCG